MPVKTFHRELNLNKTQSCMYLIQHADTSVVNRSAINKILGDATTKGIMSDAKMLFSKFAVHLMEL